MKPRQYKFNYSTLTIIFGESAADKCRSLHGDESKLITSLKYILDVK